jgi:hypothetical protein|tara:strand:+ start:58708 stop:59226 length:519 start_codon:yes stop_codon:yes gene_type:complete
MEGMQGIYSPVGSIKTRIGRNRDALVMITQVSGMRIQDDIFFWEGWGGRLRLGNGKCRLRIYDLKKEDKNDLAHLRPTIVVVSDVPESKMSVRSCAGHIATKVVETFCIDPQRTLFIEFYPSATYGRYNEHVIMERYDIVEFTWHENQAIKPKWRLLPPPLLDILKRIIDDE